MVTSRCCTVEAAERSPPSNSGMPSLPACPMKASAALPVRALTQWSTTVTGAGRQAVPAAPSASAAAFALAARR